MTYKIMERTSAYSRHRGVVDCYVVTNQPDNWDSDERRWPTIAEFPVSVGVSMSDQLQRAIEYRDYLNRYVKPIPPIGATE